MINFKLSFIMLIAFSLTSCSYFKDSEVDKDSKAYYFGKIRFTKPYEDVYTIDKRQVKNNSMIEKQEPDNITSQYYGKDNSHLNMEDYIYWQGNGYYER